MKTKKEEKVQIQEDKFTKEQLVKSKMFSDRIDLLNALLKDNRKYSIKEVNEIINKFLKGKVS